MNITSILITIVGIIIILALYVISRISQNRQPKNQETLLPDIKDDNGEKFTSILDDIPASDGFTPVSKKPPRNSGTTEAKPSSTKKIKKKQLVLFISANNDGALEGNTIQQALLDNGLSLGENDIYHYLIQNDQQQSNSLFRIANGIEPWTLTNKDLHNQQLAGLSLVMMLPNVITTKEALTIFLGKAEAIAKQVNGVIKNQQQQILSDDDKAAIFKDLIKELS